MAEFKVDGTYLDSNGRVQSIDGHLIANKNDHTLSLLEVRGECQDIEVIGKMTVHDGQVLLVLHEDNKSYTLIKKENPNITSGTYEGVLCDHKKEYDTTPVTMTLTKKE